MVYLIVNMLKFKMEKIATKEKTQKIIQTLNDLMILNKEHGHEWSGNENLLFPENLKIYNENANAPITGKFMACYDNALKCSKKFDVPLCIGVVVEKEKLVEAIKWVNADEINKVNVWLFIYPHAWNLDEEGRIFDTTYAWDLDEAFYLGTEVDYKKFKSGFGDLQPYLKKMLNY